MYKPFIFLLFLFYCFLNLSNSVSLGGINQSVGVKGRLLCNGVPAEDVLVKLWENDHFNFDDLMAQSTSNKEGFFRLHGSNTEYSSINPRIAIYHYCNSPSAICARKFSLIVPNNYIFKGEFAEDFYDAGDIHLDEKKKGEVKDCFF